MFKKRSNADEAKELFLNSFPSILEIEVLPIDDCDGRIIAENINCLH